MSPFSSVLPMLLVGILITLSLGSTVKAAEGVKHPIDGCAETQQLASLSSLGFLRELGWDILRMEKIESYSFSVETLGFGGSTEPTRPTLSQFWSFKIQRTSFLNYINIDHLLIVRLWNCHRTGRLKIKLPGQTFYYFNKVRTTWPTEHFTIEGFKIRRSNVNRRISRLYSGMYQASKRPKFSRRLNFWLKNCELLVRIKQ